MARGFGERGRETFERRFTLPRMIKAYEDLYLEAWEHKMGARGLERVVAEKRR
jgi:hypothetical protein